jgi:hypothetical protein
MLTLKSWRTPLTVNLGGSGPKSYLSFVHSSTRLDPYFNPTVVRKPTQLRVVSKQCGPLALRPQLAKRMRRLYSRRHTANIAQLRRQSWITVLAQLRQTWERAEVT